MPKLTNDSLAPLEKLVHESHSTHSSWLILRIYRKGAADEELAKKEAERAQKRELDEREDKLLESDSKRRRSASVDSVSTISTRSSRSSYDRGDQKKETQPRQSRSISPPIRPHRPSGYSREESRSISRSPSPALRGPPPSGSRDASYRDRTESHMRRASDYFERGQERDSRSPERSPVRDTRGEDVPDWRGRGGGGGRGGRGSFRGNRRGDRGGRNDRGSDNGYPERSNRQRSLSPFSKRKALNRE